jgi:polysaccharide export outer membrane protein
MKTQTTSRWAALISAFLACCGLLLGCGGSGRYVWVNDFMAKPPPATPANVIQPGDVVSIAVFGQEALSVKRRVPPDGRVVLPLVGEYPVAGRTAAALGTELEARLQPFVTSPHVAVVVEETNIEVVVVGEVVRTGHFVLARPVRVIQALAEAGGLTDFADRDAVYVVRGQQRIRFTYPQLARGDAPASAFTLEAGDVIVVE